MRNLKRVSTSIFAAMLLLPLLGQFELAKAQFITFSPVEFVEATVSATNQIQTAINTLRKIEHDIHQAKRLGERVANVDFRDMGEMLFVLDEVLMTGQNILYTAADIDARYRQLYGRDMTEEEIMEMADEGGGKPLGERLYSLQRKIARTRNLAHQFKRQHQVLRNANSDLSHNRAYIEGADTEQAIAEATARMVASLAEEAIITRRLLLDQASLVVEKDAENHALEQRSIFERRALHKQMKNIDWGDDSVMRN